MKRLVIFDLDGTLLDTSNGIIKCHQHAHRMLNREPPPESELRAAIGGPLLQTYIDNFAFSESEARRAVKLFRQRYEEYGVLEAEPYEGTKDTLEVLRRKGYILMVATLKVESLARIVLARYGLIELFSSVYGTDDNDTKGKTDLLKCCIEEAGINAIDAVLVGDSEYDYYSAQEIGIDFVGVRYGFGLKGSFEKEVEICDTISQVISAIEHIEYNALSS